MRYLLFIFILASGLAGAFTGNARGPADEGQGCFPMDSALVKIRYNRIMATDTLNIGVDSVTDISPITLFAGKKGSAFYNEDLRADDEAPHDVAWVEMMFNPNSANYQRGQELTKLEKENLFRDYSIGKTIVHQLYGMELWELREDIEKPVWEIQDSTINILGFDCIKAVADFRGRKWTAWFAPDIPLPEGPWKLCGLPGTILRAYDSKDHYRYEATYIDTKNPGSVDYFNYRSRMPIRDRRKGLMFRRKVMHSNYRLKMVRAMLGDKAPKSIRKSSPNNYDFLETDYTHVPMEEYSKE